MRLINKKGFSIITLIFWIIGFLLVWILFVGRILNEWGQQAIIGGELTGIEAFFFGNLNFVVGIVFLIAVMFIALYGGGQN